MLLTAFGAPTQFGIFGAKILEAIVASAFRDSLFLTVDNPEDTFAQLQGRHLHGLGIYSRMPELRLVLGIRRLERRCIVFYDEPAAIFARAMSENGLNPMDSARQATAYVAGLTAPLVAHETLVIRNSRDYSLGDTIALIARHFDLRVDRQDVLERMACDGVMFTDADTRTLHECASRLSAHRGRMELQASEVDKEHFDNLRLVLPSIEDLRPDGVARAVIWNRGLFFSQDRQRMFASAPQTWQELLGPARYAYCGPYLHLPPGYWEMKAMLRTRGNIAGNKVSFEIHQHEDCIYFSYFDLPRSGAFEVTAKIFNSAPEKRMEFRLYIKEGAIDGEIILDEVRWTHRGFDERPDQQVA